jgi:hypothetical protein
VLVPTPSVLLSSSIPTLDLYDAKRNKIRLLYSACHFPSACTMYCRLIGNNRLLMVQVPVEIVILFITERV